MKTPFLDLNASYMYWSGISQIFFEPLRHEDIEKSKGKTLCLCVSVANGFVHPLSDDYIDVSYKELNLQPLNACARSILSIYKVSLQRRISSLIMPTETINNE